MDVSTNEINNNDTLDFKNNLIDTSNVIKEDFDNLDVNDNIKVENTTPVSSVGSSAQKLEKIKNRNAIQTFSFPENQKIYSWSLNPQYLSTELNLVDTLLWMTHLFYPQHKNLETYTFLGNLGSPTKYDHFFSNDNFSSFVFGRFYKVYSRVGLTQQHFNVRKPFTILTYSTAGKRQNAEQVLRVLHTQNVNPYLNFGIIYDFFGTKGIYERQETRNNAYSIFTSYNKGNISFHTAFANNVFKNQENGGLVDDYFIQDTLMEPNLVPFKLKKETLAQSELRERHITASVGYNLLNYEAQKVDPKGKQIKVYLPLLTVKALVNGVRNTRMYTDNKPSATYYDNFYISTNKTYDTVYRSNWDALLMVEIEQFAKYPGIPGLRAWVGNQQVSYYYYKPGDFILNRENDQLHTNHIGVAAFSSSPYLSYQGSARIYFNGYKSDDKEIMGELNISPWKRNDMPKLIGKLKIVESTPDIFLQNYFSNHYQWDNNFSKESWFWLTGILKADIWRTEIGYNLAHINNYIYFDTTAVPVQSSNVTVTSAYLQNRLVFKGLNIVNKVVWQTNTNKDVLDLPILVTFSAVYYEGDIVKNVLRAQIGFSIFYRTKFYADAYSTALGQFYSQREKLLGNYPTADIYANLKWKRALLFFKYEHVNQGFPNSLYFSALHYPINPRIFKFGVSWMFYD